jgi:ABC-type multidrug transport system ATPase subunit
MKVVNDLSARPVYTRQRREANTGSTESEGSDFLVADRTNFTVKTGEIFGFFGSTGVGESTAIKMLTTLM